MSPQRRKLDHLIWLQTCNCSRCRGRASVCMDAFEWIDRRDPNHALRHAREDLLTYYDKLPRQVKDALNQSDVNTCAWCAQIWTEQYGAAKAAQLVRDVVFINATHAVTSLDGWSKRQQQQKGK